MTAKTEVKHTPGPWEYLGKTKLSPGAYAVRKSELWTNYSQKEGDARLISAAPELLDACKTALFFMTVFITEEESYKSIKNTLIINLQKAIAKAEGRE